MCGLLAFAAQTTNRPHGHLCIKSGQKTRKLTAAAHDVPPISITGVRLEAGTKMTAWVRERDIELIRYNTPATLTRRYAPRNHKPVHPALCWHWPPYSSSRHEIRQSKGGLELSFETLT
jgi:hypothetical protein